MCHLRVYLKRQKAKFNLFCFLYGSLTLQPLIYYINTCYCAAQLFVSIVYSFKAGIANK